jgi:TPR repeat protein
MAVAAAHPVSPPPPSAPDPVTVLLRRGDLELRQSDVMAARLFYERAAAAGSGEGATSVGKTYDPNFLATIDAQGMKGDVARAIEWYRRASTVLGDKEAGERLKMLTVQTGQ